MALRIIGGRFRGRKLAAPRQGARPTTDRTREAIFNLIEARMDLDEARVLDLYAGSGALGFEALSRGAGRVEFVEISPAAVAVIRKNATELRVLDRCSITRSDAVRYVDRAAGGFDLVLADPPYGSAETVTLPGRVVRLLPPGGLFVLEHARDVTFDGHEFLETTRSYGRTRVSLFRAA